MFLFCAGFSLKKSENVALGTLPRGLCFNLGLDLGIQCVRSYPRIFHCSMGGVRSVCVLCWFFKKGDVCKMLHWGNCHSIRVLIWGLGWFSNVGGGACALVRLGVRHGVRVLRGVTDLGGGIHAIV